MKRRPPFVVVWAAVLLLVAVGLVLQVSKPWSASGAEVSAAGTTTAAARSVVHRIAIIGDSYVGGSDLGGIGPRNWVTQMAQYFRMDGIELEAARQGAGGSGYVARGQLNATFGDLVPLVVQPNTEIVVFFGSRNDSDSPGIRAGAEAAFRDALQISPGTRFLVIGTAWVDGKVPPEQFRNRDEVRAATEAVGGTFVDPLAEGWFAGREEGLIGSDGVQPTDAGHSYLAAKILPHMQAVVAGLPVP